MGVQKQVGYRDNPHYKKRIESEFHNKDICSMKNRKKKVRIRVYGNYLLQGPEFCIRCVPLDSEHRAESSVPEFLVTIDPTPSPSSSSANPSSSAKKVNEYYCKARSVCQSVRPSDMRMIVRSLSAYRSSGQDRVQRGFAFTKSHKCLFCMPIHLYLLFCLL